jgi:hypothetical protein
MATVPSVRSREEIVDSIIADLKPLNVRISLREIRWAVQKSIDYLFESVALGRRPTTETQEAAQKLEEPLNSLIRGLKEIPPNNILAHPDLLEELIEFEDLRASLAAKLPSVNLNETKTFCAATTVAIITLCSQKRLGPSLAQTIAGHLHELVTKEEGADMKRACDKWTKMIRAARKAGVPADELLAEAVIKKNVDIPLVALIEGFAPNLGADKK